MEKVSDTEPSRQGKHVRDPSRYWKRIPVMGRYDITRKIERLDPERDHLLIVHYLAGWEFPWDHVRALEMALYRTFCVPTTSALLDKTREFHDRPQRRYDDTALIMAERSWSGGTTVTAAKKLCAG